MKFFQTVGTVLALGLPSILSAASTGQTLLVHVPFAFVMAGKEFAPGDYRVEQSDNGIILLQGGGQAAVTLSIPASLGKPGATPGLQFTSSEAREYLVGVKGEVDRVIPLPSEAGRKLTISQSR